ncbi:hypothetical protein CWE08_01995 [Aliidiomarina iranensis]|uniref:PepSY domain-containing protein n=1 Tax=Aliidiomarina iranensis TaxID=1434071 RepID=A0A432W2J2_9GAMM|nr:PepSY domain-containing protein [Aliidiomarina iranensis]RUO23441.1 hypothetical protein CWE08_01995 [Aliidiomarina iranensis]
MRFKALKNRKIHRWLTLLFGIQLIIWSITGAAMVIMQLPYIHGDHLVKQADQPISNFQLLDKIPELSFSFPNITEVRLVNRYLSGVFQHAFVVSDNAGSYLLNAETLSVISPEEEDIRALAVRFYNAPSSNPGADIAEVSLLSEEAPRELSIQHLPAWRVEFADNRGTTLYLGRDTGDLLTKRHNSWRVFDFMWMLHIMDYDERSDITKWWLQFFSIMTLLIAISGITLLVQKLLVRPWRRLWGD